MNGIQYQPRYQNSWALVIGINDYVHVSPLDVARPDAESVVQILTVELGFPKENVITLLDGEATRAKILERFLAFEDLGSDDRLLVFFAGHGDTVGGHRGPIGYLVPVDGKREDKSTFIRWDDLTRNADIIPAKHILFVMDACYSGLAIQRASGVGERRFISDMLQRRARQVITAGKSDETVADGGGPTGSNSIFTGYLLEGLRGKAATADGLLTASYLMNYVYQKVSTDPRSEQTPHFGHVDGDGDFILRTPNNEHLPGGPGGDFLVTPVVERPEPPLTVPPPSIKPEFADRNGYSDPDSENFGRNEWTKNLGVFNWGDGRDVQIVRPSCWLALVVEPVSNQPLSLDIGSLAKTLRDLRPRSDKPYEQFAMPLRSRTTAKSAILFEPDECHKQMPEECWKRFLRVERSGAIEYCVCANSVAGTWRGEKDPADVKVFNYVNVIGVIWSFLYAARSILSIGAYHAGVRYLVNLVGTKASVLAQFSSREGVEGQCWRQPFDREGGFRGQDVRCHDPHLQLSYQLVLGSLGEAEAKKLVMDCAEKLGWAYNHQSPPRCFNFGTDVFPWEQFDPHGG